MFRFIYSFIYFVFLPFRKIEVDVLFYAPSHFNRGVNNENQFFKPLTDSCIKNNLSYLILEEPSGGTHCRDNQSIPFDSVFRLIIFLRKWMKVESDIIATENKIGIFLSKTLFRNFKYKNYIVLSKSMISVFSTINKDAKLFDLQHGIIFTNKPDYFSNDIISPHLEKNNVKLLLSGIKFKEILIKNDKSSFIESNTHVIGIPKMNTKTLHERSNKNILVTLQFTEDHSEIQNKKLLLELDEFIVSHSEYTFFLKNHPRFNNEVDLKILIDKRNVKFSSSQLFDCFQICSIHLTAYSTTSFECATVGIPTLFLTSLQSDFNMFNKDFSYPLKNDIKYIENNYLECSELVKRWESEYYSTFDELKFISLLK